MDISEIFKKIFSNYENIFTDFSVIDEETENFDSKELQECEVRVLLYFVTVYERIIGPV